MALYRSPLTVTLWSSSFLKKDSTSPKSAPNSQFFLDVTVFRHTLVDLLHSNATVLFVDVAIQPEVRFIAKQNSLMKIGNNSNLVLGPFDESTPCLIIFKM
ncbi:adhesion G protein-coupled receptor B2 [Trichonephila clavipes]|nr:adhesion G protein-coupled receptor B2 [Trichonephila clavipes]